MSRPLTGAAKTAQTRRVLLDEARAAIAERPHVPGIYIAALLIRADALTPRKAPEPVTVVRHHSGRSFDRPDVRLLPLSGPQSPGRAW